MRKGVYGSKMRSMLHASDDDLPVASAPAHPHDRRMIPSSRPDGARRCDFPFSLSPWGGEVVVDALVPLQVRSGRRWG
jgi:hypothetical protein